MGLDIARVTDNPHKHRSRVVHQQGRVHVEADLNEQQAIAQYRMETTSRDVIGSTGCPADGGGFAIGVTPDGRDLTISSGRMYVDGILAEMTPLVVQATVVDASNVSVPNLRVDDAPFATGQYLELHPGETGAQVLGITAVDTVNRVLTLSAPITGAAPGDVVPLRRAVTYTTQPDLYAPAGNLAAGRYRVYLDVWEQEQSWIQDPPIREIALGGPDTAGRVRVRAQVRLALAGPTGRGTCPDLFGSGWQPQPPTGTLRARIDPQTAGSGPCVLPPTAGYQGLENQLYRVQVHGGGTAGSAGVTYKWQRDNASIVTAVEAVAGDTATVFDVGRDDVLCFDTQHLAEPSDDRSDLDGTPWPLQKVTNVWRSTRQIELDAPLPAVDPLLHAKLQRWDGQGDIVVPAGDQWIDLEFGLQVQFDAGAYRTGDFWLIPARTALGEQAGTIEWPVDDDGVSLAEAAAGVGHHYAALGLVDWDGTSTWSSPLDCRSVFPPLTGIGVGACTLTAVPGPGWETVFDKIQAGQDARICFQVGEYPVDKTKLVQGKGHLLLDGAGQGTRIMAPTAEAALIFQRCAGVKVRDLHVRAGVVGTKRGSPTGHINGALTFIDCPDVDVESVSAACAAASFRGASCLTITSQSAASGAYRSARVRSCDLAPGHQQVGVLVVNQDRAVVEDCVVGSGAAIDGGQNVLKDPFFRAAVVKAMVSNMRTLPAGTAVEGNTVTAPLRSGGPVLAFNSDPALQPAWRSYLDFVRGGAGATRPSAPLLSAEPAPASAAPPAGPVTAKKVRGAAAADAAAAAAPPPGAAPMQGAAAQTLAGKLATIADVRNTVGTFVGNLLTDPKLRQRLPAFGTWIDEVAQQPRNAASQGIVVGGSARTVVRIAGNTVIGAMMGIHVGVSQHRAKGAARESTGPVQIVGNTVQVALSIDAVRGRHGIFAGNCESLVVESNRLSVVRARGATMSVDAIRIWGVLGRMVIVRHNHVDQFDTGVNLQPVAQPATPSPLWLVADNLLAAVTGLNVGAGVITTPNNVT